ncbi:MAG: carboxypeptidase-like regulatory domain-containing protein, partial [Pyrinomonadaceae bacterium]
MKSSLLLKAISSLFILVFCLTATYAQGDGRISGRVIDPNGAAVPGASVTITNEATGGTRTTAANADGSFVVAALKPSKYSVSVRANNFAPVKKTGIDLLVGQPLDLELKLQAQGLTAQVDIVSGEDNIVNTSSATLSANVNPREVEGLPINGRQLSQLYLQAPGAQNAGSGTYQDIRFSGRANEQNVIRYDGIEGTAIIDTSPGNLNGEVPTPFRLQSSLENVQE